VIGVGVSDKMHRRRAGAVFQRQQRRKRLRGLYCLFFKLFPVRVQADSVKRKGQPFQYLRFTQRIGIGDFCRFVQGADVVKQGVYRPSALQKTAPRIRLDMQGMFFPVGVNTDFIVVHIKCARRTAVNKGKGIFVRCNTQKNGIIA